MSTNQNLSIAIDSQIGGRKDNQDYAAQSETPFGQIVIVCDGVGGSKGGGVASQLAAKIVINELKKADPKSDPVVELNKSISTANKIIYSRSLKETELRGMATTLVAVIIAEKKAIIAHVGDSRVYLIRNGKIRFQTTDHSKVQELVDEGHLSKEEARRHPNANQITRAIGIKSSVSVDVNIQSYNRGDLILLTTDGIHGELSERNFLNIINKGKGPSEIVNNLLLDSNQAGAVNKGGKHDNLTVATIGIGNIGKSGSIIRVLNSWFWPLVIFSSLLFLVTLSIYFEIPILTGSKKDKVTIKLENEIDSLIRVLIENQNEVSRNLDELEGMKLNDTDSEKYGQIKSAFNGTIEEGCDKLNLLTVVDCYKSGTGLKGIFNRLKEVNDEKNKHIKNKEKREPFINKLNEYKEGLNELQQKVDIRLDELKALKTKYESQLNK